MLHVIYNIMSLSLDSAPAEVVAFLEAAGFASKPFLDRPLSDRFLSELSSRDLVGTALCHLVGDALRILGRAQLLFAPSRLCFSLSMVATTWIATVRSNFLGPTSLWLWYRL